MEDKKKTSITGKLHSIVLLPTALLGLSILIIGIVLIYEFATKNIQEELENTACILKDGFELMINDDYKYEDGILKKGDVNISDSTMLYDIKDKSGVDTTIFWEDTRISTTVEDKNGVSAVGTKAEDIVVQNVLYQGADYFSKNVLVNGIGYFGFYTPLQNDNKEIVGMVFAGKPKGEVNSSIRKMMLWSGVFFMVAVILAVGISNRYSNDIISDIGLIKQYLQTISEGDFSVSMGEKVMNRRDEIGEIGTYAVNMSRALGNLVERDPLTALYNRRSCHNRISSLINRKNAFTVVMCDIDWFKKVNDRYGHECGDFVLVQISKMIKGSVAGCGFASRWGGEEFLLIYELDFDSVKEKIETLAEEIRNYRFEYGNQQFYVTMTFGLKEMVSSVSYEKIIKAADDNLYKGKKQGRNRIVC